LAYPVRPDEVMPRMQGFATVGHLYRGIEAGLSHLAGRLGERALFVGLPRAQAAPEMFQWPRLIAVTGLASARAAVDEIIEQGEGARIAEPQPLLTDPLTRGISSRGEHRG
jgi:Ferritin-like